MSKRQAKGVAIVIVSAASSATLAILLKFAFAAGANITTIISIRFLVASLLLWLVLKARRMPLGLPLDETVAVCAMGTVGYGGMSLLFAFGLHAVPAALAGMLLYTYPAIVSLLSFLLREERFNAWKGGALMLCLMGLYLVLGVSFSGTRPAGVVAILASAFIYSVYILVGNRLLKRIDPLVAATYICGSTGLAFTIFGLATRTLQVALPLQGWLAILGITVFPTFIGIVCFLAGLRLIGASRASILCTLEPFITLLLAFLLLAERVAWLQLSGGALILSGVVLLQWKAKAREDCAVLDEG